jgi:hypothetical protein
MEPVVWWWIGNAVLLLVVVPLVVFLANRVIGPAREIKRYGDDILEHGVALAGNLDPLPALQDTRAAVAEVKANAVTYLGALTRLTRLTRLG